MPINRNRPIAEPPTQQAPAQEQPLENSKEQVTVPEPGFMTDQMDIIKSGILIPTSPGLIVFDPGLHPGSGFPQGTLQTTQGYLVVPNTKGFGFCIYPPGTDSIAKNPIAITTGSTLIDRDGKVLADFKTNNQAILPFGLTVTTHSSNTDDPFNGRLSFSSGGSTMEWNVVENVQARLSRDTAIEKDSQASLKADQEALTKAQDVKEKSGFWAGVGTVAAFIAAPIGAIIAAVSISKGVSAGKEADAAQSKVNEDQKQIAGAESRIKSTSENVYELAGTRRFLKDE